MQEQNTALMSHVGARITAVGAAEDRMRSTIDAYFSFTETRSAARKLLFDHANEDDPEIRIARQGIRESRAQAVTSLLADDMRAMGVDPREPIAEAMVELIITGLDGVAQWWERNPDMPRSLLVEGVARLLWNGLGRAAVTRRARRRRSHRGLDGPRRRAHSEGPSATDMSVG
ncbi:hypothetical protein ACFQY7_03775 [Actinomadura luteofluorescens]|uniref:hypothetical protein n=1 Tax=Actinomadura luteofluorescens TaxID=46163 RepID=UPI00362834FA